MLDHVLQSSLSKLVMLGVTIVCKAGGYRRHRPVVRLKWINQLSGVCSRRGLKAVTQPHKTLHLPESVCNTIIESGRRTGSLAIRAD